MLIWRSLPRRALACWLASLVSARQPGGLAAPTGGSGAIREHQRR